MADSKRAAAADQAQVLPPVINGETGTIVSLSVIERKTTPPKPYTEGGLIEDMANCSKYVEDPKFRKTLKAVSGLGTAATRAAIIEDLKRYGLLSAEKGKLVSTEKGRALIGYLPAELYDIARTAIWEAELDLIASGQGNQVDFESGLLSEVRRHVNLLQESPAMPAGNYSSLPYNSSEAKSSSRSGASKTKRAESPERATSQRSQPTEKQLEYATKIAERLNLALPPAVRASFDACRDFIDKHSTSTPPSDKAISFAESIAKRKSLAIPDRARKSSKELSAWIDANKG